MTLLAVGTSAFRRAMSVAKTLKEMLLRAPRTTNAAATPAHQLTVNVAPLASVATNSH